MSTIVCEKGLLEEGTIKSAPVIDWMPYFSRPIRSCYFKIFDLVFCEYGVL